MRNTYRKIVLWIACAMLLVVGMASAFDIKTNRNIDTTLRTTASNTAMENAVNFEDASFKFTEAMTNYSYEEGLRYPIINTATLEGGSLAYSIGPNMQLTIAPNEVQGISTATFIGKGDSSLRSGEELLIGLLSLIKTVETNTTEEANALLLDELGLATSQAFHTGFMAQLKTEAAEYTLSVSATGGITLCAALSGAVPQIETPILEPKTPEELEDALKASMPQLWSAPSASYHTRNGKSQLLISLHPPKESADIIYETILSSMQMVISSSKTYGWPLDQLSATVYLTDAELAFSLSLGADSLSAFPLDKIDVATFKGWLEAQSGTAGYSLIDQL